jgi:hypothetical protein
MVIETLTDFQNALVRNRFSDIAKYAEKFLRASIRLNDSGVKRILMGLISQDIRDQQDDASLSVASAWLSEFPDPELVDFFLAMLDDVQRRDIVASDFHNLNNHGLIAPGNKRVVNAFMKALQSLDCKTSEPFVSLLAAIDATEVVDLIFSYTECSYWPTRATAVRSTIYLSKLAGRQDLLEKLETFLRDPEVGVRYTTCSSLKYHYPEKFAHLDIKEYLP